MNSGYYPHVDELEGKTLNCAGKGLDGAHFDRMVKCCWICHLAYAEAASAEAESTCADPMGR